jgi:ABC-type multidrug transport system ATPase subunit
LPENLDWPGNLNYQQLRRALAPDVVTAEQWSFLLGLDPKKKYRLLSKGNRQKVRLLLTEAIAQQHKSEIICLDEPLSGLDYRTREVVWKGWRGDLDWSRAHRIVSMHPTDIPYNPDQVIAAARGGITVLPFSGRLSWDQIKTSLSA